MTRLLGRLLHRAPPPAEAPCPRCGVPAPAGASDCMACGWDLHESYHGPVGMHEEVTRDPRPGA